MGAAGADSRGSRRAIRFGILLLFSVVLSSCGSTAFAESSHATVQADPLSGAIQVIVRDALTGEQLDDDVLVLVSTMSSLQADDKSDDDLRLQSCSPGQSIYAWAPGYYVKKMPCDGRLAYEIKLESYNASDNPYYAWIDATIRFDSLRNCQSCHSDTQGRTEYLEWSKDGHSKVFVDPYFPTMYMGTDVHGNPGRVTQWGILNNGRRIRLAADPSAPYDHGPGYRLDYPDDFGNCAYCHAPAAVRDFNQEADLAGWTRTVLGSRINVETEGITCDVCHKVTDVILGDDGLPYVDRPGVLSVSLLRPTSTDLFFVGPRAYYLAEEPAARVTCSPVFSESRFCAACHYGKFSDVEIYASYKEWLNSPYSQRYLDPVRGVENKGYRSCQDCHMPSSTQIADTLPSERAACSKANLNFRDFSHNMMKYGPAPEDPLREIPMLIREAATLTVEPAVEGDLVRVPVTVQNTGAGHKFPTDSPMRHLILLVEAKDQNGTPLAQVAGPVIPPWGGMGNLREDYAGRPGEIYAHLLKDRDTNVAPTAAYWNPTKLVSQGSDTRLDPLERVHSQYSFAAPDHGPVHISVSLIYRYAFIDLARRKQWNRPDMLVTSQLWECNRLPDSIVYRCQAEE